MKNVGITLYIPKSNGQITHETSLIRQRHEAKEDRPVTAEKSLQLAPKVYSREDFSLLDVP